MNHSERTTAVTREMRHRNQTAQVMRQMLHLWTEAKQLSDQVMAPLLHQENADRTSHATLLGEPSAMFAEIDGSSFPA
jgi:hypothetical protein